MRMQNLGAPPMKVTAALRETGPAAGMAARTPRSRKMPPTNGSGAAQARIIGERVYLLFDWDRGARRGLIDAMRESPQRLVGKYINLSNPAITRPWVGRIVSDQRIDGRWPQGRLDFRR